MQTKRNSIEQFRKKLREQNADSDFSNQFLYSELISQAEWLIKREINSGRIYKNTYFFQTLPCREVIEIDPIHFCCQVKSGCKTYRTKNKLPAMWIDNDGPIIKSVTSIDGFTHFTLTTPTTWNNKVNDPYQKYNKENYTFFSDGYLWFPDVNPNKVNVYGFYQDDVELNNECDEASDCVQFLDTNFIIPSWIRAELFDKATQSVLGLTKRVIPDEEINKNTKRV